MKGIVSVLELFISLYILQLAIGSGTTITRVLVSWTISDTCDTSWITAMPPHLMMTSKKFGKGRPL